MRLSSQSGYTLYEVFLGLIIIAFVFLGPAALAYAVISIVASFGHVLPAAAVYLISYFLFTPMIFFILVNLR